MPHRSIILIRTALVNFALGITLGAALLIGKALPIEPWISPLRSLHVELLAFGFLVQIAFGVALWILPRSPVRRPDALVSTAGILLNAGAWLAGVGGSGLLPPVFASVGRLAELGAVTLFAYQIWPRVRALRDPQTTP